MSCKKNNNFTMERTDIVAISPYFVCEEVMAVDYIITINKIAAGGKHKSRLFEPNFSKMIAS